MEIIIEEMDRNYQRYPEKEIENNMTEDDHVTVRKKWKVSICSGTGLHRSRKFGQRNKIQFGTEDHVDIVQLLPTDLSLAVLYSAGMNSDEHAQIRPWITSQPKLL